jgi:hypothetical protein
VGDPQATSILRGGQYRVTDWSSLNKSYKALQGRA